MAEQLEVDLIVKAIAEGFAQVAAQFASIGDAVESAGEDIEKANDEISDSYDEIREFVKRHNEEAGKTPDVNKKSSNSFHELESKLNLASRAFNLVMGAISGVLNEVAALAETVDNLSRSWGVSAEEASRVYQMTDDLRISQAELEVGMRNLIDGGVQPTIENIKNLSSQYLAMEDPVQRAQFAMELFGARGGQVFQKLLELGPGVIDTMSEANEALVVDESAIQSMKDYQAAVDSLQDSLLAFKMIIAGELAPGATRLAEGTGALVNAIGNVHNAQDAWNAAADAGLVTQERARAVVLALSSGSTGYGTAMAELVDVVQQYNYAEEGRYTVQYNSTGATNDATEATQENADVLRDSISGTEESGEALEEWAFQQEAGRRAAELSAEATADHVAELREQAAAAEAARQANEQLADELIGAGSMASPIAAYIEDLKFLAAGGGEIMLQFEAIKEAFKKGTISLPEAQEMLSNLYVAAEAVEVEIGVTTEAEAVENIGETLGVADAQGALDAVQSQLDTITSTYFTEQFVMDLGIEMTPDAQTQLAILHELAQTGTINVNVVVTGDSVTQVNNSNGGTNYD